MEDKKETQKSESAKEKLADALSILMLLENDLFAQQTDPIYARAVKVIHQLVKSAQDDLNGDME